MTRWNSHSVWIVQDIVEVLQCQFSSDTIVAAAQLVNRGLLNSSTAFSNEKKRKKYRQHSFNFCVRVTALCLAQSVYSQCTQKCTLCTQNVLSVFPIPLLFNALITVLTNYSLLISCDHLMSEPELRVLYLYKELHKQRGFSNRMPSILCVFWAGYFHPVQWKVLYSN